MVSYVGGLAIKLLGAPPDIAFGVSAPALVGSGWAAFGHLITLDDEYPGGWSNIEGSKAVWRASLREMLAKLGLFVVLLLGLTA